MHNPQFTGRVEELQLLNTIYNEASNGFGKLVFISGNPGLGKSELIREFIAQTEEKGNCLAAIAECNDKEGLNSYAPFKELMLKLHTAAVSDTTEKKTKTLQKLKNFITDAGTQWIGMIPVVGGVAQAGLETFKAYQEHYGKKEGEKVQSEDDIYRIFENEFRRLAENKTLILFLDDLQWADSSSLNLIFSLGRSIRENPFKIIIIGTYREFDIEAGKNKITESGQNITIRHPLVDKLNELRNYTKQETHITRKDQWLYEFSLKAFTKNECQQLINSKFPDNKFNSDFHQKIYQITDGQPLYLIEILDYLSKKGDIKKSTEGYYYTEDIQLNDLPVSVQAIINEKVGRLNDELKKVLSYASVSGEEFAVPVVEKLLKIDELDLLDYLEELSKKHGLLVANEPVHVKDMLFELYKFTQTLVHKHIYENLDGARRRALHRRIAETLKNLYGDELEKYKEVKDKYILHTQIGQGLIDGVTLQLTEIKSDTDSTESNVSESVFESARAEIKLAQENMDQFAVSECLDRISKALGFIAKFDKKSKETEEIRFSALSVRAEAQLWAGFFAEGYNTGIELQNIANYLNNKELEADADVITGKALHRLGKYDEANVIFTIALDKLTSIDNKKKLIECINAMAKSKELQAKYDEAIVLLNKSLEYGETINDEGIISETLLILADNQRKKGVFDTAQNLYEHALSFFEKQGNLKQIGFIYNSMGLNIQNKGEYDKSITLIEKALDIAKKQNDKINITNRLNNIGLSYKYKGDYQKALDYFKEVLEMDQSINDRPKIALSYDNLGSVYVVLNEFDTALDCFNKSLEIHQSLNDRTGIATCYTSIAESYYYQNDLDKSLEYINKSIEIDKELNDSVALGSDYVMLGNIYYAQNDYDNARKCWVHAMEIFESKEDPFSVAKISNNLGGLEYSYKNYEKAVEYYEFAYQYYSKTDDAPNIAMLRGNMGNSYSSLGDFEKAETAYKEAINLYEQVGDFKQLAIHAQSLGILYYNKNLYNKSIELLEKSTDVYDQLNNDEQVVYNVRDIADAYVELQQYENAITYFKKSIVKWVNEGKFERAAFASELLANLFNKNNDIKSCIETLNNAVDLADKAGNKHMIIDIKLRMSYLYKTQDQLEVSGDIIMDALKIAYSIQDPEYQAKCHKEMGWLYYNGNDFDRSIEMCEKAIEFHNYFENDYELADTYYLKAESMALHQDLNVQYEQIEDNLNRALSIYNNLGDIFNAAYCLNSLGAIFIAKGDSNSALSLLNQAKEYMIEYDSDYDINFIEENIAQAKSLLPGNFDRPGAV